MKRVAIVTGGLGGIGSAVVDRLIQAGANVTVVDLNTDAAPAGLTALQEAGRVALMSADASQADAVEAARNETINLFGRIDILVNAAGGAGAKPSYQIDDIEIADWDRVIEINLKSTFLMCRAVIPAMRAQKTGRIVNFSSVTAMGETGIPTTVTGRLAYATAKSALIGFTRQLAKDVGEDGITVNALLPGLIVGPRGTRIRDAFERLPEETQAQMRRNWPTGRPGNPDEVAAAVEFLCSESASYISGTALPVDGAFL